MTRKKVHKVSNKQFTACQTAHICQPLAANKVLSDWSFVSLWQQTIKVLSDCTVLSAFGSKQSLVRLEFCQPLAANN
jgi:hypothetical protein